MVEHSPKILTWEETATMEWKSETKDTGYTVTLSAAHYLQWINFTA